mgnify:CR=1 FL=1|tara:strand:- start:934 stop:1170 length:237 start_codon:yes stop_codon:yes gene_type:complete
MKRQKRRHNWNAKHLRKHRFNRKGFSFFCYWEREKFSEEDHEKRRMIAKTSLHKVINKGYEEEECYFPTSWRNYPFYY